jgi:hypothetical protein
MDSVEGICFEPGFAFWVGKVHETGVHPTAEAIKRHVRGKGNSCKGDVLREAVAALTAGSLWFD